MRSVIIFTVLTVFCCGLLFWVGASMFTGAGQHEGPEKKQSQATENCSPSIIAELGGMTLRVPRDLTFQLAGAPVALEDWGHPAKNCNIMQLSKLHRIEKTGNWQLIDPQAGPAGNSQFYYLRGTIRRAMKQGAFEKLENGVEMLEQNKGEIYLLPPEAAPTHNNEPVAVACEGPMESGVCATAYFLPGGLYFTYRFGRSAPDENGYLLHDRQMRAMISGMRKAAGNTR